MAAPAQSAPPETTKDRLSLEAMALLVAAPMELIKQGDVDGAKQRFEQDLKEARSDRTTAAVATADALTAFGVSLYTHGLDTDDAALKALSLDYLERAVPLYKAHFGPNHPEVALALTSHADVAIGIQPDDPPRWTDASLEESYRIRRTSLGPSHTETLSNLFSLARFKGLPSRTGGDPVKVDAAVRLMDPVIEFGREESQMSAFEGPIAARFLQAGLYADNGQPDKAIELAMAAKDVASGQGFRSICSASINAMSLGRLSERRDMIVMRSDS